MATPAQVDVRAGLDVGKGEHFAGVLDDDGERLFARAVANDQAALEALLDRAARHGTPGLVTGQPGSIAQLALAVAARREVPVAYVPGLVMRRAADLYPGEAKTGRRDAYVTAGTGRTRRKQVHWLDAGSDELLASLRVLNGYDIDLAADATRLASRLRDALTSISPALERAVGDRLHQAGARDLLAACPTLTMLRAAGKARIERTIKARSPRIAGKVTTAVMAAVAAQDVTVPAEAATGRVIAELAAELDRVCGRRDALAAEIEEAFLNCPFGELLASLPGIGPRAGARILAETGDGPAFANGSKLAAYAGLAPLTRQSGTSLAGESRSRRGSHRLKNAMFLAAFAALRDPASKAFYDRKRAEGKRHNAALICLARRRCDVILAMLRTGQRYQPARPALATAARQAGRAATRTLAQPVLPALPPVETRHRKIFQRHAADDMIQTPAGGDVADDQHPPPAPAQRQISEEPADPPHRLPPALPTRIRTVQIVTPARVQLRRGHPVALPVITLPQPPVTQHRNRRPAEGDGRRLHGPAQIGAEHRGNPVLTTPPPESLCLHPALLRQPPRQPAGGTPRLVVLTGRMGLKHQLDGHQPTLRATAPPIQSRPNPPVRLTKNTGTPPGEYPV
ncbi:MAG TPA: IS110 family transposase [Streptosporangiaceae bacterium]